MEMELDFEMEMELDFQLTLECQYRGLPPYRIIRSVEDVLPFIPPNRYPSSMSQMAITSYMRYLRILNCQQPAEESLLEKRPRCLSRPWLIVFHPFNNSPFYLTSQSDLLPCRTREGQLDLWRGAFPF